MSKSFLKVSEAYNKLGLSGGGTNWIRKSELIATGKCDTTKLEKYGNNDFVIDDDIVLSELEILLSYGARKSDDVTLILPKTFNPSRPFLITGNATFYEYGRSGVTSAFVIHHSNKLEKYLMLNLEAWGTSTPLDFSCNIKNQAIDGWINHQNKNIYLNTAYNFSLEYDGTILKRTLSGSLKTENVKLGSYECDRITLHGNPLWYARSGDCLVNVTIKHKPKS